MENILRIDLGAQGGPTASLEPLGKYAGLGGRGLTSCLVADEVDPRCDALGEGNKLVLAPGLLSGTPATTGSRLSVGCKSPLTGGIKESNAGGRPGAALAKLGYAAVVLEGRIPGNDLWKIVLGKEGVSFERCNGLRGLGNYDTVARLSATHGLDCAYLTIGQAGEMKLGAASIACTDRELRPTRHCGRGGVGAVMGSKNVKAIVLEEWGASYARSREPEEFKAAAKAFAEQLERRAVTGRLEGASTIGGETQAALGISCDGEAVHGCLRGCVTQCPGVFHGQDGTYLTEQPEHETVWSHGGHCGIDDLDAIAQLDRLDDDIGLDGIEVGVAIGLAMEAGVIELGDSAGAIRLVREIGQGTPLGRIIGSGAGVTGKAFGVERVPITTSSLEAGGLVDPLGTEGQAERSRRLQIASAAVDSTGLCLCIACVILDQPDAFQSLLDHLDSCSGLKLTGDDVTALGKRVLAAERDFNRRAGFTEHDDRLPESFQKQPLAPHQVTFKVTDAELDQLFDW